MPAFDDVDGTPVSFRSSWKESNRSISMDENTQTNPQSTKDAASQSVVVCESSAQTTSWDASDETKTQDGESKQDGEANPSDSAELPQDLEAFIAKRFNSIMFELDNCSASKAFDELEEVVHHEEKRLDEKAELVFELSQERDMFTLDTAVDSSNACTSLSWNATGSQLAAGFGQYDTFGWCDHRGKISIWNVFGRVSLAEEKPTTTATPSLKADFTLESSSGVMCVAYHPVIPALLASGNFNGEVSLWNTANEEPLVGSSLIEDFSHREPIVDLQWVQHHSWKEHRLVSVSAEGKVLVWTVKGLENGTSSPSFGCTLQKANATQYMGCTAFSFLRSTDGSSNTFVVGSEGGSVCRCTLNGDQKLAASVKQQLGSSVWTPDAVDIVAHIRPEDLSGLKRHVEQYASKQGLRSITPAVLFESKPSLKQVYPNAVSFAFEGHTGPVYGLECSPFHRKLFLTSGVDGTVRLYSLLRQKPLMQLYQSVESCYIYDTKWSPSRPTVFAAATSNGELQVYDLAEDVNEPVVIEAGGSSNSPVHAIAFNAKTRGIVAAGDSEGVVRIFKLGWSLSNKQPNDTKILNAMTDTIKA